jgi:hypothetical protein
MMRRVVHFVISLGFLLSKYMMTLLFIDSLIPYHLLLILFCSGGDDSLKTVRPVFPLSLQTSTQKFGDDDHMAGRRNN